MHALNSILQSYKDIEGNSFFFQVDGGKATEEEKKALFDVLGVQNLEFDTISHLDNLNLSQNGTYYAWIMGKFSNMSFLKQYDIC